MKYQRSIMKNLSVLFFVGLVFSSCKVEKKTEQAAPAKIEETKPSRGASLILKKDENLPITTFNITFRVGSADDPEGRAGISELTALLLRDGGVKALAAKVNEKFPEGTMLPARTREQIEDALYPLAAQIGVQTSREQTSFTITSSEQDAAIVLSFLAQVITSPAFAAQEFNRLKTQQIDYLMKRAPNEDEEELGKTALNSFIFGENHRYAHSTEGRISDLQRISLQDVQNFYKQFYTKSRLTIGAGGAVSAPVRNLLSWVFQTLPGGSVEKAPLRRVEPTPGVKLQLVRGPFEPIGVHIGHVLPINRSSPDFPLLYLASTAFGKHRSFVGRLMNVVREVRSLNYGTYSYVEDFPWGGQLQSEPSQVARQQQAFTMWGRPTTPQNGCFLLRQMYREMVQFSHVGLSKKEFELTRSHLLGTMPISNASLVRQLGVAIDSEFYGIKGDYISSARKIIEDSTWEQVNSVIRKYIEPQNASIVVVTNSPEKFLTAIQGAKCEIQYAAGVQKPEDVLKEDKEISTYPIALKSTTIVSADKFFK